MPENAGNLLRLCCIAKGGICRVLQCVHAIRLHRMNNKQRGLVYDSWLCAYLSQGERRFWLDLCGFIRATSAVCITNGYSSVIQLTVRPSPCVIA